MWIWGNYQGLHLSPSPPQFNYHIKYVLYLRNRALSASSLTGNCLLFPLVVAESALQQVASTEIDIACSNLGSGTLYRLVSQLLVSWLSTFRCQVTFLSGQLLRQLEKIKTSKQKKETQTLIHGEYEHSSLLEPIRAKREKKVLRMNTCVVSKSLSED